MIAVSPNMSLEQVSGTVLLLRCWQIGKTQEPKGRLIVQVAIDERLPTLLYSGAEIKVIPKGARHAVADFLFRTDYRLCRLLSPNPRAGTKAGQGCLRRFETSPGQLESGHDGRRWRGDDTESGRGDALGIQGNESRRCQFWRRVTGHGHR